jgi:hypothetical protein
MDGKVLDEVADAIDGVANDLYHFAIPKDQVKNKKNFKCPYKANQANVLALDNTLRSSTCTRGLVGWQNSVPIQSLKEGDERFKVMPDDLPDELRGALNGRKFRSAVLSATGDTHLEVTYSSCTRSLWSYLDSAANGFNGRLILFYFMNIVGTEAPDFTHRRVRTNENAITQAKLAFAKKEWEIVLSYLDGPFHSHANYQEFIKLFDEMRKTFTFRNAFFRAVYAWYVFNKFKGKIPIGFGSDEHMAEMWDAMALSEILKKISAHYARGRWYAFNDKFRLSHEDAPILFMVLMYKAVAKGEAPDAASLPLFGGLSKFAFKAIAPAGGAPDAAAGAADAAAVPVPEVAAVKHSNESLEAVRRKIPATFQFTLNVMSTLTTERIVNGITVFGSVFEEDTKMDLHNIGKQEGRKQFHVGLASGDKDALIKKTLRLLRDPDVLTQLGFFKSGAALGTNTPAEDKSVAEALMDFVTNLIANELEHMSFYRARPPFRFMQHLSPDATQRFRFLVWVEQLTKALFRAEDIAINDAESAEHLKDLLWPSSQLCRKLLVSAHEMDFKGLPTDVEEDLEQASRTWGGSVPCEYAHRQVGIAASANANGSISRQTKWHRILAGPLLPENEIALPVVQPPEIMKATKTVLAKSTYEAEPKSFSLGEEKYDEILEYAGKMPNLGSYLGIGLATDGLVAEKGEMSNVKKHWLSMLAMPGLMLYRHDEGAASAKYVLRSSQKGIYVLPVRPMVVSGQRILSFKVSDDELVWESLHFTTWRGWMTQATEILPPSM